MPLNEVGATTATSLLIGWFWALLWGHVFARQIPGMESLFARRAAVLRLTLQLLAWSCLVVGCALCALVCDDPFFAVHLGLAAACLLGLALLGGQLLPLPEWSAPLTVLAVTLTLGVDRRRTTPHGWAWLLSDGPTTTREVVLCLLPAVLGAVLHVCRRPAQRPATP